MGFYGNVPGTGTLAEHWDGTSWSLQATPDPAGAGVSVLEGVSCPAAGFCAAVGRYQNAAGKHVTLAETWNGTVVVDPACAQPGGGAAQLSVGRVLRLAHGLHRNGELRDGIAQARHAGRGVERHLVVRPAHAPPRAGPQQPVRRVLPVAWCLHRGGHPDREG